MVGTIVGGPQSSNFSTYTRLEKGKVVISVVEKQKINYSFTFNEDDLEDVRIPYQDALVIKACIFDFSILKVLVDIRSGADGIYAFNRVTNDNVHKRLKPYKHKIYGFNNLPF